MRPTGCGACLQLNEHLLLQRNKRQFFSWKAALIVSFGRWLLSFSMANLQSINLNEFSICNSHWRTDSVVCMLPKMIDSAGQLLSCFVNGDFASSRQRNLYIRFVKRIELLGKATKNPRKIQFCIRHTARARRRATVENDETNMAASTHSSSS